MSVSSNQSTFLKSLNKSPRALLSELKEVITNTIVFLDDRYISDISEFKDKIDFTISEGHGFIFKIHSYLQMLLAKDENQSHKFVFEECSATNINMGRFLNSHYELKHKLHAKEIDWLLELSKIKKDSPELAELYTQRIDILREEMYKEHVLIFNSYINDYYLSIMKIKELLARM